MADQEKTGIVEAFERIDREGLQLVEVKVDVGGGRPLTLEQFDSSGEDSPPLPGDSAAIGESTGSGAARAAGYADTKNAGVALAGEKRTFARDENGNIVAEIWLKRPGLVSVKAIAAGADIELSTEESGGVIKLNGVTIDKDGNITAPGEVTSLAAAAPIALTTHVHTSAASGSPTSPPTPPP